MLSLAAQQTCFLIYLLPYYSRYIFMNKWCKVCIQNRKRIPNRIGMGMVAYIPATFQYDGNQVMIRFLASLVANGNCRVCWVFGAVLTVAGSLLPSKLHLPTIFANILWPLACYWRPGSLTACRLFQNSSFLESFYQVIFSFSACAWVVESIHQNLGDHAALNARSTRLPKKSLLS